jgi:hypothetical protein
MKPGMRAFPRTTFFFFFLFTSALIMADETTMNLSSVVLDGFDQPDKSLWIVKGSNFATQGFPQTSFMKAYPAALFGKNKDNKELASLGVHGKFDRKAYNFIELIPAKKADDGTLTPNPIGIPGRVKSLDLWVWGSNYDYYMDVHIRDYLGVDHVLRMGDLLYEGWKDLNVNIPSSLPQSRRYIPRFQGLVITEFVIWTRPTEKVDDFYIFIDQLKVLTDMFEARFDGDELADSDTLNQIWSAGAQATQ